MLTKSLFAIFSAIIMLSVNAAEVLPKCKPWQSQGLTPVKIKFDQKLAPLTISKNGKAMLKIVIPAKKNRIYYRGLAIILQKYLKESTGADFQIVKGTLKSGKGIFIGPCENTTGKTSFDNIQKQAPESFTIKSFPKGIMLIANDQHLQKKAAYRCYSRGTLFATIDFLERMIGYRFYFPEKLGTCLADYSKTPLVCELRVLEYSGFVAESVKQGQTLTTSAKHIIHV